MKERGEKEIFCTVVNFDETKEKAANMALNKVAGVWNEDLLNDLLIELQESDFNMFDFGFDFDFDELEEKPPIERRSLASDFIFPPFTVLDTRRGEWQERKKSWYEKIQDNGESRNNTLGMAGLSTSDKYNTGVSILDPVAAELIIKWFCVENGKVFDCFAGDTVAGYVAATLGHEFTGIELRQEQAELNNERTKDLTAVYINDDGQNITKHIAAETQDLFFSCPPYYDLEVYSDLENDASNQKTYKEFLQILENAFSGAIKCLKENRFAAVICGDIRDKKGFYRGFNDDIKTIFKNNGMQLYNELILVEQIGTLPQRVRNYMKNRKVGKCHQNILIFYKGNPKEIKNNYRVIEFASEDMERSGFYNGD